MAGESWGCEVVRRVESLPIIRRVLRKLGVRGTVDALCPIRDVADFTHGQVLEVMVANRLTGARPLYDFEGWADQWAVAEIFGVPADKLNDDRLGRTLDAVADNILPIFGSASANAIIEFAIQVNQMHNDATSLMFEGHFTETDPDYPKITRGYNAEDNFSGRPRGRPEIALARVPQFASN